MWTGAGSAEIELSGKEKMKVSSPMMKWVSNDTYLSLVEVDGSLVIAKVILVDSSATEMFKRPVVENTFTIKNKLENGKIVFSSCDRNGKAITSENLDTLVGMIFL